MVNADCNFKTGKYIKELKDPSNIKSIEVSIPKSASYTKNALKIITSRTMNIPPDLRKKFYADILVDYGFGKCAYEGTVRQTGDIKDHISMLSGGYPVRSLKVKLDTGNIVSAVHFKLLLPATRNGVNEILSSLILRRLEIISPETFAVQVKVNKVSSVMLFQEDARKELLEKSNRRESAIFEGDEELLWSFENYKILELKKLSLSKMVNENWFEKGRVSQDITLHAFSKLQRAYAKSALVNTQSIVSEDLNSSDKLSQYIFVLAGMHGHHAFGLNNRKFYFDPIQYKFEPIYYDGNTSFKKLNSLQVKETNIFLSEQLESNISLDFIKRLISIVNSEELKIEFLKRAEPLGKGKFIDVNLIDFLDTARANYIENIYLLTNKVPAAVIKPDSVSVKDSIVGRYLQSLKESTLKQKVITQLKQYNDGYIATFASGKQRELGGSDVTDLISKNRLNNERAVFIGKYISPRETPVVVAKPKIFVDQIITSPSVKINVSEASKVIKFIQTYHNDWVLIQEANLTGWKIVLQGVGEKSSYELPYEQNFNEYGLTGCLNFYKTEFQNSKIEAYGGSCEDSVNIISSRGSIDYIQIENAFSDGVDIDFSKIIVNQINVQNAGNDCIDVSSGNYKVDVLNLINCNDKAVSVGENSKFVAKILTLETANIGVSSKDSSKTEILEATINNVALCVEVKQKKQEFGGAFLWLGKIDCSGDWDVGKNSVYKEGPL